MSVIGGRGGRHDDWASDHARARARTAERLDGPLDPDEAAWLDEHLASCAACSAIAADYAAQRSELRALRDRPPVPPRDLWARTAAAIERESRHGRRTRRSTLRPYALLAGALVVAVAVGTLTSSQWLGGAATTTPGVTTPPIAIGTPSPSLVAPTPLAISPKDVAYLSRAQDGSYTIERKRIDEVCPSGATACVPSQPHQNSQPIGPLASPKTVFGSEGKPLVVMGTDAQGSAVFAVLVPTAAPGPDASASPSESATATPTTAPSQSAVATASPTSALPSSAPPSSSTPSSTASPEVTASSEPTASPSELATTAIEIAPGLQVIDTNAAYAPDGSAFAFTAQPADGSHGPDIYVWQVGEERAQAVTTDHSSVFGSWSADGIVGSSVAVSDDGSSGAPSAIVVSGSSEPVAIPEAGSVWRPAVDPSGSSAVYWTGTLAPTADGTGWKAADGRIVIGRWGDVTAGPDPSASAQPTAPAASDQPEARRETTIVEGPLTDWDARWDPTGSRLAVWVADPDDPSVGKLSLYVVDPFDGSIKLANPPLEDAPALAGFSIADGRLAWATPADGTDAGGRVLILAWTEDGFGQIESAPGDFVLVR